MLSAGVRNPRRSMFICAGITLVAWASVAWGTYELNSTDEEPLGASLMVGIGLLPAMLAPFLVLNFWRGVKVFAAIGRGERQIARWHVTAAELAAFAENDKAHTARGIEHMNEWSPPREMPPGGVEIIFVDDGVLVGDTYFALATIGIFKFTHVWLLNESPPAIAFRTILTSANRFGARTSVGALRIPVAAAAAAEAAQVIAHYQQLDTLKIIATRPGPRRVMLFGLILAPISFVIAAIGIGLKMNGLYSDSDDISGLLISLGIMFSIAGVLFALIGWRFGGARPRNHD